MFTIPNEASASFATQSEIDAVDIDMALGGRPGIGVRTTTDCAVTQRAAGANMSVDVSAGLVFRSGSWFYVSASNVAISAADATNPRFDLVSVGGSGTLTVTAGTPAASPVFPALPSNNVPLAVVYVPANDTAITDSQIIDKRRRNITASNLVSTIARSVAQTDYVNTAAEQTVLTFALPANLLASDGGLRFTLHATLLNNSGASRSETWAIKFGATTLWQDSIGVAANANRRPFTLVGILNTQNATNVQTLTGVIGCAATTAPTTGLGALASPLFLAPIGGSSAEDTTASKTLVVTMTHAVANANLSFRVESWFIEYLS